ncbi:MAG TPA: hypothetical protein VMS31_00060 [Pyrinomonadaceae bacterium]|nr:hypothetical protein [Pyrinomonadaceae bacterium]
MPAFQVVDPPSAAHVACAGNKSNWKLRPNSWFGLSLVGISSGGFPDLEIDDDAKEIVRDIGTAINESVENSSKVAEAIERLRDAGYEMELTLRLEIGLRPHSGDEDGESRDTTLDLTDEDVQVLQRMKIRIDPEEKI